MGDFLLQYVSTEKRVFLSGKAKHGNKDERTREKRKRSVEDGTVFRQNGG